MDLTAIFSNDQLAVIGCFGALAVCGLVAAITFHAGPAGKKSVDPGRSAHLRMPQSADRKQDSDQRKAA